MTPRTCPICQATLVRRFNEERRDFEVRRTCGGDACKRRLMGIIRSGTKREVGPDEAADMLDEPTPRQLRAWRQAPECERRLFEAAIAAKALGEKPRASTQQVSSRGTSKPENRREFSRG